MSVGQLSPDRNQYWDGQKWTSALSTDGRWRWDGAKWASVASVAIQQLGPAAGYPVAVQPQPMQYPSAVMLYRSPTNSLAVASLVFGIVSWFLCPLVGGVVAIVCGHMAHGQIKTTGEGGAGMATAGLVLGYIHLAGWAVFALFWLLVFGGLAAILAAAGASNH